MPSKNRKAKRAIQFANKLPEDAVLLPIIEQQNEQLRELVDLSQEQEAEPDNSKEITESPKESKLFGILHKDFQSLTETIDQWRYTLTGKSKLFPQLNEKKDDTVQLIEKEIELKKEQIEESASTPPEQPKRTFRKSVTAMNQDELLDHIVKQSNEKTVESPKEKVVTPEITIVPEKPKKQSDANLLKKQLDVLEDILKAVSKGHNNDLDEEELEAQFQQTKLLETQEEQLAALKRIEKHLAGGDGDFTKKELIGAGALGAGLTDLIPNLFKGIGLSTTAVTGKMLAKGAFAVAIIASVLNGIKDGFYAYMETGSLKEAVIDGLGGIIKVVSLGFFDRNTIADITEGLEDIWVDYIKRPIEDITSGLANIFRNLGTTIKELYADVFGMLSVIGFDEIKIDLPWPLDKIKKSVSIGPFYPFKGLGQESDLMMNSVQSEKQFAAQTNKIEDQYIADDRKKEDEATDKEREQRKKRFELVPETSWMDTFADYMNAPRAADMSVEVEPSQLTTGDQIYNKTSEVMSETTHKTESNNTVIAPQTTVSNNTAQMTIVRPNVRNLDASYNRYLDRKMQPIGSVNY